MEIKKVHPQEKGQELFDIDNAAFIREFDLKARSIQEEVNYLKNCDVYIAYQKNQAIGFIGYKKKLDSAEIMSLAVIPEYQNKGIGKMLLNHVLGLLDGKKVYLVTHPKNTPAIIVYLKLGFEIYGLKENYYGDGQPRLLLRRHES
jgi:ribosomal-protein-alanine N-acetyltransferase